MVYKVGLFVVSVCIALSNSADLPNYGGALGDNAPTPSQHFENRFALDTDQNYWLFWTADTDAKTILFETHVKTHGYIGFGISPNGKMYPSDVVVGWVKDGQAYLKVRPIFLLLDLLYSIWT